VCTAEQPFEVKDAEGKTCLKAELEANFTIPYMKNDSTWASVVIPLPENAIVSAVNSSCGDSTSVLVVQFPDTEFNLTIQFTKTDETYNATDVTFDYVLDKAHFTDADEPDAAKTRTITEGLFSTPNLQSYKCDSQTSYNFVENGSMSVANVKLQAFDFNGNYSEASVCQADLPVTTPPPTEAQTTAEATTLAPPPTTTLPPPPTKPFRVMDGNSTCLIADFGIKFEIKYPKVGNTTGTASFDLPDTATVASSSSCGKNQSTLVLNFPGNDFNLTMVFERKTKTQQTTSIKFDYTVDEAHFPNATNKGAQMDATATGSYFEAKLGMSYQCDASQTVNFDNDAGNMLLDKVRIQAFDVKDDTFGEADHCAEDVSSTAAPVATTVVPPPTPNSWNVTAKNGSICMRMQMGIAFTISYQSNVNNKTENQTVQIDVDDTAKANSSKSQCVDDNTHVFVLTFPGWGEWNMTMTFVKSTQSSQQLTDSDMYSLKDFTLHFVYDERMPNAIKSGQNGMSFSNETEFNTPVGNSYKCSAEQSYPIDDTATLILDSVQIQPFVQSKDGAFGQAQECEADQTTSNIVPIAVGCALAGLVIIVLIAYLIGRRRSHASGYQSV